ncbi:F-box/kelch-repeat protein At3g06240-like [Macadamia integrifolia]|uniref:F-box/kelch-repeat protein At3g06240-like n=1 Tax=Macadamia integrifolia TaxID=60698 RepID=UPI001C500B5C|nr:F-box/kelch-repeat protein At3g06240-like [Macadamia integrifolia]
MEEIRNTHLPQGIIYEILSRLPIESVLRCMSVCKLWSAFRHDPYFIHLHLTKSMIHQQPSLVLEPSSLIASTDDKVSSLLMLSPNGEEGGGLDWKVRHIPLGFELESCFNIVGSCNGILCIGAREVLAPIFLFNPITRERKMLPKSFIVLPPTYSGPIINSFGFGFDSLSNKYKVVRIYKLSDVMYDYSDNQDVRYCEIITVGDSSWRKLDLPRTIQDQYDYGYHLYQYDTNSVILDGTIYWIIKKYFLDSSDDCEYILALDIDSEKFWTIDCNPPREYKQRESLIHMDGSIAIIDYAYTSPWSADIWLLKGSKSMGFSFTLITYDMSGLGLLGDYFSVLSKHGHDTFLLRLWKWKFVEGNQRLESTLLLYSPVKKQYSFVQAGHWKADMLVDRLLETWMVPTLARV